MQCELSQVGQKLAQLIVLARAHPKKCQYKRERKCVCTNWLVREKKKKKTWEGEEGDELMANKKKEKKKKKNPISSSKEIRNHIISYYI